MGNTSIAREVRRELNRKSVLGLWRAGRLIIDEMGSEWGRNKDIVQLAKALGDERRASLLQQACRLANYWKLHEARKATKRGLSIRRAIALVALDGMAERYRKAKEPRTASQIRSERRRLLRKGRRVTAEDILGVKIRFEPSGLTLKRLSDGRRFVLAQLKRAHDRMVADESIVGGKLVALRRISNRLHSLIAQVKKCYLDAKTKES